MALAPTTMQPNPARSTNPRDDFFSRLKSGFGNLINQSQASTSNTGNTMSGLGVRANDVKKDNQVSTAASEVAQAPQPQAQPAAPDQQQTTAMATTAASPPEPMAATSTAADPLKSENASDIAAQLMQMDSRLMQRARTQGLQFANQRGLGNSSIAGQASQAAMLDQIVPLASQTASQNFQGRVAGEDRVSREGIAREQIASNEMLTAKQIASNESLQRAQISAQQATARAQISAQQSMANAQIKAQKSLAEMNLAAQSKQATAAMIDNSFNSHQNTVVNVMSNPNLSAEERASIIQSSQNFTNERINLTQSLYGTEFNWPPNSITQPTTPAPAAAPA